MKPKIYATGNENINGDFNVSHYIFEKDASFSDWLSELLEKVFEMDIIVAKITDFKGKYKEGDYTKKIEKMIDVHEKYEKKGQRVDVFYGKNRVYITIRKSKEVRKKFADFVKKTKSWIKIKEIKEKPVSYERI